MSSSMIGGCSILLFFDTMPFIISIIDLACSYHYRLPDVILQEASEVSSEGLLIKNKKGAELSVHDHPQVLEVPERGLDKSHTYIFRCIFSRYFQQILSALRAQISEVVSGVELFWKPGWGRWLGIVALIGCGAGIGGIVFSYLIHLATSLLLGRLVGFMPLEPSDVASGVWRPGWGTARLWLLPIIVAAGGLISGLLTCWARNADGTEAKGLRGADSAIQAWYESVSILKIVPLVVMMASSVLIGSGGSAGIEGPSAQIGLGIGSLIGDFFHLTRDERSIAQSWGMGALVATMFHSPTGGGIFAGEILRKRGADLKVIPGALLASIIACTLDGWGPTVAWPGHINIVQLSMFGSSALLGILCGLTGRLYVSMFHWTKQIFNDIKLLQVLKPALGGLMVGLLGLTYPQVLGLGSGWLQVMISPQTNWLTTSLWIIFTLPFAKILATCLSVGSGGIGGIFGPGMIIGGLLGAMYWSVLHLLPLPAGVIPGTPAIFIVIGMVALLGPIAHTPIAVTIMVANMIGNTSFVLPAVVALVVSSFVVRERTLYPSQR